jgi:hypothetical protein
MSRMSLFRRLFPRRQQPAKPYVDVGTALAYSFVNTLGLPGWKDFLPVYTAEELEAIDSGLLQFQNVADKTLGGGAVAHPDAVQELRRSLAASQLFEFAENSWRFVDEVPVNWRGIASTYLKSWVGNLDPFALQGLGEFFVAAGHRAEAAETFKVILFFPSYANTFYYGKEDPDLVERIVNAARDSLSSLHD